MSIVEFREKEMYQQKKLREEHTSSSGASFCKEVTELRLTSIDSQAATSRPEFKSVSSRKSSTGFGRNCNNVHELLDCTVCMDLMHPPIYQVPYSNCDEFQNLQCLPIQEGILKQMP